MCVLTAPNVFDQRDDGIVKVLREQPDSADEPAVRQAVTLCPSGAVRITYDGAVRHDTT
jgi:ferredoxin